MGRNAKRRRMLRDAEAAVGGGRTRHQVRRRALPRVDSRAGKISPAGAAMLAAGMAMWGAVRV